MSLLKIISAVFVLLGAAFSYFFYRMYLRWITVFEDGRYFDPDSGVVYHETGVVWGLFALVFFLISGALWLTDGWLKRRARLR